LATKVFNHYDKSKHDKDIKAGAISIICSLIRSFSPFFITKSKEVYWLCKILIQLYRCNEDRAKVSFCLDGSTLIINLLEIIEINYRLGKKGDMNCLVLAQNLFERLLSMACVPLVLIKRHEELMSSLVSNINGATGRIVMLFVSWFSKYVYLSPLTKPANLTCIASFIQSIKCVSVLSEHQHNKQSLLTYPGLIKSVEVGSRHMSEAVREESARIICNLAWDARYDVILQI
jgi:hypothetical protein